MGRGGGWEGGVVGIVVRLEKVAPIHAHLATLCSRDDRKLFQCLNMVSDNKTGPIERGQCDVTLPW